MKTLSLKTLIATGGFIASNFLSLGAMAISGMPISTEITIDGQEFIEGGLTNKTNQADSIFFTKAANFFYSREQERWCVKETADEGMNTANLQRICSNEVGKGKVISLSVPSGRRKKEIGTIEFAGESTAILQNNRGEKLILKFGDNEKEEIQDNAGVKGVRVIGVDAAGKFTRKAICSDMTETGRGGFEKPMFVLSPKQVVNLSPSGTEIAGGKIGCSHSKYPVRASDIEEYKNHRNKAMRPTHSDILKYPVRESEIEGSSSGVNGRTLSFDELPDEIQDLISNSGQ